MADSSEMPKVDMAKEFSKLSETEQHYVKKLEGMNTKRVTDAKKLRFRARVTGFLLAASVVGIYFYSMAAVKQEKFLDFEEMPEDLDKKTT